MAAPIDRYRDRPGIPTKHKDRQMRSILEKRWATFFDLLGWRYEYEPFELDGWIPDFLLFGSRHSVLVEIKPVTVFPRDVAEKVSASGFGGLADPSPDVLADFVLALGCSIPLPGPHRDPVYGDESYVIGWLHDGLIWEPAVLGFPRDPSGHLAIVTEFFAVDIPGADASRMNPAGISRKWAEAGNAAQWKAPR